MEEPAHNEGCCYDTEQDGPQDLLPPVQQEHGVLPADVLAVAGVVQESHSNLGAPLVPVPLVVWQIVSVIFKTQALEGIFFKR